MSSLSDFMVSSKNLRTEADLSRLTYVEQYLSGLIHSPIGTKYLSPWASAHGKYKKRDVAP